MSLKSVPESLPHLVLRSLHYFHLDYHCIHPLSGSICLPPVYILYFSPSQHLLFSILYAHAQSLSRVWLFETPWTVTHQAPLSLKFSRQEYLSGLPFPTPEDLPDPGTEHRSPALQAVSLPSEPPGKPSLTCLYLATVEGNSTPLQYSCLENPMDGGAW